MNEEADGEFEKMEKEIIELLAKAGLSDSFEKATATDGENADIFQAAFDQARPSLIRLNHQASNLYESSVTTSSQF